MQNITKIIRKQALVEIYSNLNHSVSKQIEMYHVNRAVFGKNGIRKTKTTDLHS